ncbi:hypothetical protein Ddc_24208 [Ditylenchus destructor]|nr:hypothetical protein Ddc_24208 [Ditylenchus destructor]
MNLDLCKNGRVTVALQLRGQLNENSISYAGTGIHHVSPTLSLLSLLPWLRPPPCRSRNRSAPVANLQARGRLELVPMPAATTPTPTTTKTNISVGVTNPGGNGGGNGDTEPKGSCKACIDFCTGRGDLIDGVCKAIVCGIDWMKGAENCCVSIFIASTAPQSSSTSTSKGAGHFYHASLSRVPAVFVLYPFFLCIQNYYHYLLSSTMSNAATTLSSGHDSLQFGPQAHKAKAKVTSISSVTILPDSDTFGRGVTDCPDRYMDPRITDKPQLGAKTEWYYIQTHLHGAMSAKKSEDPSHTVIVCIFRQAADNELDSKTREHNWAVIYATLDWKTRKYSTYSKVPSNLPKHLLKSLQGKHTGLSKTIKSMLQAGPNCKDVPLFIPDDLLSSPVQVHQHDEGAGPALHLEWDNGAILFGENGSYHLKVPEIKLEIQVHATKRVMLHGHDGETLNDKTLAPDPSCWGVQGGSVPGTAWVDHEYSLAGEETKEQPAALGYGWNWISLVSAVQDMEVCITQTWLRMPSFYEGAVRFSGTWQGTSIQGFGAMELVKGTDMSKSMEQTLENATSVVRQEREAWIPASIRPGHFEHITRVHFDPYEEEKIQQNIVNGFYMLNDRGGKNW